MAKLLYAKELGLELPDVLDERAEIVVAQNLTESLDMIEKERADFDGYILGMCLLVAGVDLGDYWGVSNTTRYMQLEESKRLSLSGGEGVYTYLKHLGEVKRKPVLFYSRHIRLFEGWILAYDRIIARKGSFEGLVDAVCVEDYFKDERMATAALMTAGELLKWFERNFKG